MTISTKLKNSLLTLVGLSLLTVFSQNLFAAGTFIKIPDRGDMVYDDARDILYITQGSSVLRYSLATHSFLTPFELSGDLVGIDISQDDNTLAIADHNLFGIHLIDLKTGQASMALYVPTSERGTYEVAFSGNNTLLISASYDGSGWVPLRKYDFTTNTFTILSNEIIQNALLSASADGSVIAIAENISDGPFGRYRVADGNLNIADGYDKGTSAYNSDISVNRNGTQFSISTYTGTFIADANLVKIAVIGDSRTGHPSGAAYDPAKDVVYYSWSGTPLKIYAYNTTTLQKIASYDLEGSLEWSGGMNGFPSGRTKISKDGKYLFVTVTNGVSYIDLTDPESKTPNKNSMTPDTSVHWLKAK
jgi:hypothetical protein